MEEAEAATPADGKFTDEAQERDYQGASELFLNPPRVQEKSRLWLDHHRFFERTGIPAENLRFCLERPQKALHCAELGISHFIDDRSDVLHHLAGIVPHRFLFGPQRPGMPTEHGVVACVDWPTTVAAVMTTLR